MKATRKPLVDEVWCNVSGNPMPDWAMDASEREAKGGTTFIVHSHDGNQLCRVGYYMIHGPTDTYVCSPEAFAASYEIPEEPVHPLAGLGRIEDTSGDANQKPE